MNVSLLARPLPDLNVVASSKKRLAGVMGWMEKGSQASGERGSRLDRRSKEGSGFWIRTSTLNAPLDFLQRATLSISVIVIDRECPSPTGRHRCSRTGACANVDQSNQALRGICSEDGTLTKQTQPVSLQEEGCSLSPLQNNQLMATAPLMAADIHSAVEMVAPL